MTEKGVTEMLPRKRRMLCNRCVDDVDDGDVYLLLKSDASSRRASKAVAKLHFNCSLMNSDNPAIDKSKRLSLSGDM